MMLRQSTQLSQCDGSTCVRARTSTLPGGPLVPVPRWTGRTAEGARNVKGALGVLITAEALDPTLNSPVIP